MFWTFQAKFKDKSTALAEDQFAQVTLYLHSFYYSVCPNITS